jgi:hypothetical protein
LNCPRFALASVSWHDGLRRISMTYEEKKESKLDYLVWAAIWAVVLLWVIGLKKIVGG